MRRAEKSEGWLRPLTTKIMSGPTRDKAIEMERDGSNFFTTPSVITTFSASTIPAKGDLSTGVLSPCVGSPEEIRESLRMYEQNGVDQVLVVRQGVRNRYEVICESLERLAGKCCRVSRSRSEVFEAEGGALAPIIERQ